jgi:hypothetical protein
MTCVLPFSRHAHAIRISIGSSDSISVSGDENLEPDIGSLDLSLAAGRWACDEWGEGSGELFEDLWGCAGGESKKARGSQDF